MTDDNQHKPVHIEREQTSREAMAYHVTDPKGRAVGGMLMKGIETVTHDPERTRSHGYVATPATFGRWYTYSLQATRDGSSFGASNHGSRFRTEAERDEAARKAVAKARKRAEQKFSPAG